jgi:hypothetical protein
MAKRRRKHLFKRSEKIPEVLKPIDLIRLLKKKYPAKIFISSHFATAGKILSTFGQETVHKALRQMPKRDLSNPVAYLFQVCKTIAAKAEQEIDDSVVGEALNALSDKIDITDADKDE